MNDVSAYQQVATRFARAAVIGEAQAMLDWDAAAMMPAGGGAARGEQLAVLAGLAHAEITAPATGDLLAAAGTPQDDWEGANLRLMRHVHRRATALPPDLVEAQARARTACEQTWRAARLDADFARVRPYLAEVVRLARAEATCLSEALGLSPYDALMDGYQPGVTAAIVGPIFAAHAAWLAEALPRAEAHQAARQNAKLPDIVYPEDAQEALCRDLAQQVGLEQTHMRLDRSAHPFCGGTPTDVRITTRYDTRDPTQATMGVLHECGHALYERGLPPSYARQPVGRAAGMAAHESQSLLIEMQACRGDAFLNYLAGRMSRAFRVAIEPAALAAQMRRVHRGFIRVDADEMTYPAHVILRFELEQALIGGSLDVADLPAAWHDGLMRLLGVAPPDDRSGCLQDIHWYDGAFGYFPSYTLGAMAAAQLMAAARRDVSGIDAALAVGDLLPLVGWLRTRVHAHGARLGFFDLIAQATGKPFDVEDFQAHLTARYLQESA